MKGQLASCRSWRWPLASGAFSLGHVASFRDLGSWGVLLAAADCAVLGDSAAWRYPRRPDSRSPHYWLGSGTPASARLLPITLGNVVNWGRYSGQVFLELSRWLLRTGLLPFARLLSSLKTGVGGGMSSPLTPSPGILPVFPVWKQRTLAGAGGLDRCENVYFWRYCTAPEALLDFEKFVVWFWKLLRLRSREFVVFRFKIFWVLCIICIMLTKDVGLSSQFWLFY